MKGEMADLLDSVKNSNNSSKNNNINKKDVNGAGK